LEGTQDPAIKQQLKDVTSRAVDLGLCGAPSFIVKRDEADDGMLFWGQDRLEFVEKALGGWRPKSG
ncbi:MAG: DsbA family protein, partial [Myxococcota bacterium]